MKIKLSKIWKLLRPVLKKFASGLVKEIAEELKSEEREAEKEARKRRR